MVSRSRKCLPADMWAQVLCRLPVESLVRCMSVCKTWHQIIRTAFFVKTHLEYQKTSNTNKYVLHDQTDLYTLLTDFKSIFDETHKHSKLYYAPQSFGSDFTTRGDEGLRIQGICDGLLCISDKGYNVGDDIYLWNPICRKAKKLPKLQFSINEDKMQMANCGLSFGYYNEDYKVIAICPVDRTYIVSIYSLSTNCWKIIHTDFHLEDKLAVGFLSTQPTKFVDGNAFMITYERVLVCFDLRDEAIKQFKLPLSFEITMEVYRETIAVLGCGQENSPYLYFWILRDKLSSTSPWERKLVIELQEVGLTLGVGFLNDNQYLIRSLIWERELTKFLLCDLKSPQQTEFISQDGYPDVGFINSNCVESLLLLNEDSPSPFVRMETGSTTGPTMFILYNKNKDIPNELQAGKNVESKQLYIGT